MEEADTLCNRIGIITHGILRTIGPQMELKKKYGGGYRVTLSIHKLEKQLIDRNSLQAIDDENAMIYDDNEEQDEDEDKIENEDLRKSINSFVDTRDK